MLQNTGVVMKKRKSPYSRKGCLQCKKSHTKCDETKPACLKCVKRNVECTYKVSFVFQKVETGKDRESAGAADGAGAGTSSDGGYENVVPKGDSGAEPNLDLRDYIYVSPTDLTFLNLLTFDTQAAKVAAPFVPSAPLTNVFQLSWRNASWVELYDTLKAYDPIQAICNSGAAVDTGIISLDSPELLNFVWTMMRSTLGCGNFIMYPQERFDVFVGLLLDVAEKYQIVEQAVMYDVALLMKDIYFKNAFKDYSHIWDRYVRMPSLKPCLDTLQHRINKTTDFSEVVSLALAVFLLFAANSTYRNAEWRTHLKGSWHMMQSAIDFLPREPLTFISGRCMELYQLLKDWFCHAEILACITSDNGGSIRTLTELNGLLSNAPYSHHNILGGRYDLIRGYVTDLFPIFTKITLKLLDLKSRGVSLHGTNILRFLLVEHEEAVTLELRGFGLTLLRELQVCKVTDLELCEIVRDVSDLRLQYTMKNSAKVYHMTLELYVKVFFVCVPLDSAELVSTLEQILETLYAMPYYTTSSVACHWGIYLSALVSALIGQKNIHLHFVDILSKLASNGMIVAANSITRLAYISRTLENKNYEALVNPSHDYIVY
ncbi:ACR028Cp [Eremothecium gossypii ATCC 10895]|uniref:ACR028Cp n=1 Tax=Eremothecium gossypii (strain ATCC 10895 / CBS 109.51 / FGSC 9923 / NRRL Y-1056) TaxID=284811 RepID=Q75C88_EREGS|nr:ACR028Cp [Eremothecium gossypii ATCC 10895]AAS51255.1 ACR028Cp [Eremothecium gossypii ATCC 10895]AEY95546.1 FACR028Cp [Eremothecium gossypii FDAG1]